LAVECRTDVNASVPSRLDGDHGRFFDRIARSVPNRYLGIAFSMECVGCVGNCVGCVSCPVGRALAEAHVDASTARGIHRQAYGEE